MTPTPKIAAAGGAGALALVLVWIAGLLGLDVPGTVEAAFALLISLGAGYLKSDSGKHAAGNA